MESRDEMWLFLRVEPEDRNKILENTLSGTPINVSGVSSGAIAWIDRHGKTFVWDARSVTWHIEEEAK